MKESEIKLNRGQKTYQLTVDNDGYPTVRHTVERTVLQTTHHAYGELRLTVLTKSQTPTIKHLTAANILETLLK